MISIKEYQLFRLKYFEKILALKETDLTQQEIIILIKKLEIKILSFKAHFLLKAHFNQKE